MSSIAVLEQLRAYSSEQTRKIYRKYGVTGDLFGVNYSALNKLKKKIKINHDLALQLWSTGNHDARILALMIADPQKADSALLDAWADELGNYVISDAFSTYVGQTALAREKVEKWTPSDAEWIGATGWNILGYIANNDEALPDSFFEPYLKIIERDIHNRKNRVRHSMNGALIAIGGRNPALEQKALDVAQKIGKVQVDHGETNCKTPDATAYIQKTRAHHNAKA